MVPEVRPNARRNVENARMTSDAWQKTKMGSYH